MKATEELANTVKAIEDLIKGAEKLADDNGLYFNIYLDNVTGGTYEGKGTVRDKYDRHWGPEGGNKKVR